MSTYKNINIKNRLVDWIVYCEGSNAETNDIHFFQIRLTYRTLEHNQETIDSKIQTCLSISGTVT